VGFIDGYLDLPASAPAEHAMRTAEAMLADWGRQYYHLHFAVEWNEPDVKGWIPGEIRNTPLPTPNT
jgi:hypothetical protein